MASPSERSSARRVGPVPVAIACTSAGSNGACPSGRWPRWRIRAASSGLRWAYLFCRRGGVADGRFGGSRHSLCLGLLSLLAHSLHGAERAHRGLGGSHHGVGLAHALVHPVGMRLRHRGKPHALGGPRVGSDGAGGETRLERIGRAQHSERGDGSFVAGGALLGGVAERRRQGFKQQEDRVAGDRRGKLGKGVDVEHRCWLR